MQLSLYKHFGTDSIMKCLVQYSKSCAIVKCLTIWISEMLKRSRGRYTPDQIRQVAIMSGAFGSSVQRGVEKALGMLPPCSRQHHNTKYRSDVHKFSKLMKTRQLFEYVADRSAGHFQQFNHTKAINEPAKLGHRICELSTKLDFWRKQTTMAPAQSSTGEDSTR